MIPARIRPLRVAMVEDEPCFQQRFTTAIAAAEDMTVAGAFGNGRDALKWLERNRPDVLLADLKLPDIPGLAVITYCAQQHPSTEILVISMFEDAGHVMPALEAGASGYLLKDAPGLEICARIRELAEGGSPMTPTIARLVLKRLRPEPSQRASSSARPMLATDFAPLTEKELQVLTHIAQGFSYQEIADLLSLSSHTVHTHTKNIYRKLSVHSRTEAVYEANRLGLIDPTSAA